MTIINDEQLERTLLQELRLYRALRALRERVERVSPENFATLADGPLGMLRDLRREIDEYAGVLAAEEHSVELWIRVTGPAVADEIRRFSVIKDVLQRIRKSIASLTEALLVAKQQMDDVAQGLLESVCDLDVVTLRAGSLVVGVRLPPPEHLPLPGIERPLEVAAKQSFGDYAKVAALASSNDRWPELPAFVPDADRRRLILAEVVELAPTRDGQIDAIELSGHLLREVGPARLQRDARRRIQAEFEREVEEHQERYEGDLREMDIDRRTFKLRNVRGGVDVVCTFLPALTDEALSAFNCRVRVTGKRRVVHDLRDKTGRSLFVAKLEKLGSVGGTPTADRSRDNIKGPRGRR